MYVCVCVYIFPSFTGIRFHGEINFIFRFAGRNKAVKSKYCNSLSLVSPNNGRLSSLGPECRKICGLNNIFAINWFPWVILGCCFPEHREFTVKMCLLHICNNAHSKSAIFKMGLISEKSLAWFSGELLIE